MKKDVNKREDAIRIIKGVLIGGVLLLIVLVGLEIGLFFSNPVEKNLGKGSLGEASIWQSSAIYNNTNILKNNCSDYNLKEVWDFGFNESSDGIVIIASKDSNDNCNSSLMYKILDDNMTYGVYLQSGFYDAEALFFYGNFSENMTNILKQTNVSNYDGLVDRFIMPSNDLSTEFLGYLVGLRNISDIDSANNEYHNIFRIDNGSWSPPISDDFYSFGLLERPNILQEDSIRANILSNATLDYLAYLELHILPVNLTQTNNIPNFVLNLNEYRTNALDLDNYFANLGQSDGNLSFSYETSNSGFRLNPQSNFPSTHTVDFNASNSPGVFLVNITLSYSGLNSVTSNNFNVSIAACYDSDSGQNYTLKGVVSNISGNYTDSCFNSSAVTEYYCENLSINDGIVNSTVINCNSGYYCSDGACIQNNTNQNNTNSTGDNSSNNNNNNGNNNQNNNSASITVNMANEFRITNPIPPDTNINISTNSTILFIIGNNDFDSIKWYLDSVVVKNSTNFYEAKNLTVGNHTIKVEIVKGSRMDSRTWQVNVLKEENPNNKTDAGSVLFWVIIVVVIIIAILIVTLYIMQNKYKWKKEKPIGPKMSPVLELTPEKK